ncbi:glycosyltransferase [Robbsia sp. Bb-Pol-6]|uniref:Glycosyltransferase n=1 Tax=Robbsia betulipollinis TaxID=2981849 RepID=A0ABT3ZLZ0_9BURK|nr:glycosyltransferase [Robbsia betulipollinis]MCY0387551.1 glycosyltransferase [Robbsia betulipollinis]
MKIAIVSTYAIECGIARFAQILERDLSQYAEVTVFPLNRHELKEEFGGTDESADKAIAHIVAKLKGFDAVSIQHEYSLFASTLHQSNTRVKKLVAANPNTTITFHTVLNRAGRPQKDRFSYAKFLRPKRAITQWLHLRRKNADVLMEIDLFNFLKEKKAKIVVHTKTTRQLLEHLFSIERAYCHPLSYTRRVDRDVFNHTRSRTALRAKYAIPDEHITVGVFGYFGNYKGFDYAIECLARLPAQYQLLVFAGLHPSSIKSGDTSQIQMLTKLAAKLKVLDRVSFLGAVDDDDLYRAIAGVDFSWLPYREVGQEASAICSEVAELSKRMLVSRNFAFSDYVKFDKRKNLELFEISNIEELKLKTLLYDTLHPGGPAEDMQDVEFAEEQARFYMNVLKTTEQATR